VASAFGNISERGAIEVIFCDPCDKIKENAIAEYRERTDNLKNQLVSGGITMKPPQVI